MYALVDCNNFFVSCERVFRPELEGKAVVVLSNNDGCVVSRSNESKAMGIKMGTPFFQLKDLVDDGTLIAFSSNYALYGDLSQRVMSILTDSVPQIEVYSIDEAFMILDGISEERLVPLCREIRAKVLQWVGIPVSIGLAPTKTLAKVASHFAKIYKGYKGVCVIDSEQKRLKALELTPISDVWGIGRRLSPKLESSAVYTALDYVKRPRQWVKDNFNLPGLRVWEELQGVRCVHDSRNERRKSICTSRSFAEMIADFHEVELRVADFAAKCAEKLRQEKSAAYTVNTFLYTNRFREDLDQYYPSAAIRLNVAASSAQEIVGAALKALRLIWKDDYQYKKAGVVVYDIVPDDAVQTTIFDFDEKLRERQDKLSKVIDTVRSNSLLRLASQRSGHYADGIRSEHRSRLYSTSLDDIIDVH